MKEYDEVKVVGMKEKYKKDNISVGEIGTIWLPEIRNKSFYVCFDTGDPHDWYKYAEIDIEDLEVVKSSDIADKSLLEELPKNDPHWWCKVEDGYILNLLGEKKNKIPYDYNS